VYGAGSRKVTAATAFLLALFSHILNHVVIRLQGALYERENPNKILQANSQAFGETAREERPFQAVKFIRRLFLLV